MPDILHIRRATAILGETEEAVFARLEAHRETLPRAQARRMNHMGLALELALAGETPGEDEPILYASCYGMARSLEDFLTSFPHPSPLAFQNAIHPAGIEQYLVPRKAKLGELLPFATGVDAGMAPVLRALFLTPGTVRRVLGGEERGTWLADADAASDGTFAFSVTLTEQPEPETIGTFVRDVFSGDDAPLSPRDLARAIDRREPARIAVPGFGTFSLAWQ